MEHHLNYNTELRANLQHAGQPSTPELNDEFYRRMMLGDLDAKQQLIVRNTALVIAIIESYLHSNPQYEYLRDEFIGDAFLRLVDVIDRLSKSKLHPKSSVSCCLSGMVPNVILNTVAGAPVIRSNYRATQPAPAVVSATNIDIPTAETGCDDLRDLIDTCCNTDQDRQLIALREEGYTYPEIANLTGSPRRTVINHVHAIRDKVYQCLSESS
jgi:RNA polymerase sigma factor (sigma-70 family)